MTETAQKRFWFHWDAGAEYVAVGPAEMFDKWIESTLLREGLEPSYEQFGDPEDRPPPHPIIRPGRTCGDNVTVWLRALYTNPQVKRHKLPPNAPLSPAKYPLSLFIASGFTNFWEPLPALTLRWQNLVRPFSVILDGLHVDHGQIAHQGQVLQGYLSKLVGHDSRTACYGPVVTARLE